MTSYNFSQFVISPSTIPIDFGGICRVKGELQPKQYFSQTLENNKNEMSGDNKSEEISTKKVSKEIKLEV